MHIYKSSAYKRSIMSAKKIIGEVTHYYPRINVAVVKLSDDVRLGDRICVEGATTSFEQTVESMESEHRKIEHASAGQLIGLKVKERVRTGDRVYRIEFGVDEDR